MARNHGRQFALLHKKKMQLSNISTCCEGQATRMLGSLPEHVANFDLKKKEVYVDLYTSAEISLAPLAVGDGVYAAPTSRIQASLLPSLVLTTDWPSSPEVSLSISIPPPPASTLHAPALFQFGLQLRMPSWVATDVVAVALNNRNTNRNTRHNGNNGNNGNNGDRGTVNGERGGGKVHSPKTAEHFRGVPGQYLNINRKWLDGDVLTFNLPMALQSSVYTGHTQIAGHRRYAVEYGPILLAAVGGVWNTTIDSILIANVPTPENASSFLERDSTSSSLQFKLKSSGDGGGGVSEEAQQRLRFVPYYTVQEELFEVYCSFPSL